MLVVPSAVAHWRTSAWLAVRLDAPQLLPKRHKSSRLAAAMHADTTTAAEEKEEQDGQSFVENELQDERKSPTTRTAFTSTPNSTSSDLSSLPPLPLPSTPSRSSPAPLPPRILPALPVAPAVIILRGISGSGKSSIAKHYQSLALACSSSSSSCVPSAAFPTNIVVRSLICSADTFFMRNNRYVFDSKLLSQAHSACLASFLALLASHTPHVIVDNTNIQKYATLTTHIHQQ